MCSPPLWETNISKWWVTWWVCFLTLAQANKIRIYYFLKCLLNVAPNVLFWSIRDRVPLYRLNPRPRPLSSGCREAKGYRDQVQSCEWVCGFSISEMLSWTETLWLLSIFASKGGVLRPLLFSHTHTYTLNSRPTLITRMCLLGRQTNQQMRPDRAAMTS